MGWHRYKNGPGYYYRGRTKSGRFYTKGRRTCGRYREASWFELIIYLIILYFLYIIFKDIV